MKTKIVLWGANEKDEKVLLGIELVELENSVKIYVFPESEAKENFYNQMLNEWREGKPVQFPENHQVLERPLSVTEDLLPETIKVSRTDVINRAKTEWHFVVLSAKLYQLYKTEITEFRDKISQLISFDKDIWEELKTFWSKVQQQVYDKNLFRDHARELQTDTNQLFDNLKELRKKLDQEFQKRSKERAAEFRAQLKEVEEKVSQGMGLQPLWNEMKNIQTKFRSENIAKGERNEIWDKIDELFKLIKEKRYGKGNAGKGGSNNALERLENRYNGLMAAIKKMENSIKWDKKDLNFQGNRIEETFGQLEQEIRKAKLQMVNERVSSKEAKLADMMKTKVMLEEKMEKERAKQKKQEEHQKVKEKEKELKEKMKQDIQEKSKEVETQLGAALTAASEQIKEDSAPPSESKAPESKEATEKNEEKVESGEEEQDTMEALEHAAEDIIDTVKAAAKVIKDKISEAIDEISNSDLEEE